MGSGAKKHLEHIAVAPALPAAPGRADDDAKQWLTPIPEELQEGMVAGHPVLVGGADLADSLATLIAYHHPDGPIEVLHAQVTTDAQAKLIEALAVSDEQLIPVEVDKDITGRLPLDTGHDLYGQLHTVVKSVNHHLKAGDGIPAHTHTNFQKLHDQLDELAESATGDEQAMIAAYQAGLEEIAPRLDPDFAVPYQEGGKVGWLEPYEVDQTVTVTDYIPAPTEHAPGGLLAATVRTATRLKPTIDDHGRACWDGTARSKASGIEYDIDLGGGFQAVYRPYPGPIAEKEKAAAGHRGHLEIIAPPGAGHAGQLIDRLGDLNLVNRPMTPAEGEWAYLKRNIWAQRLATHPQVASALTQARTLADTVEEVVLAERAGQVDQLADSELGRFARDIRLEAEARALPHQVSMVRDAVATATGHPDGQALKASPGYEPTPRPSGGWLVWDRFDVAGDPKAATGGLTSAGKVLYHRVTGNNIAQMLRSGGVLACTERRRLMGLKKGLGMSESSDMKTGGSQAVDLRVGTPPKKGPCLVWSDPGRLLRRADWYAYPSDHFAAAVDEGGHSTSGQTRTPADLANFGGGNEVLFRHGLDLLSKAEAPDRILCTSKSQRSKVLKALTQQGITTLAGQPIEEVVQ